MAPTTNSAIAGTCDAGHDRSPGSQGETAVSARLAMCSALWGRTNIASCTRSLLEALSRSSDTSRQAVHCLVGVDVAGPEILKAAADRGFTIFEADPVLHEYLQGHVTTDGGHSPLSCWPAPQPLGKAHYQSITTAWSFSATSDIRSLAGAFSDALAPGGRLCVDELWSTGGEEGRALGQTLALWRNDLVFKDRRAVVDVLTQTLTLEEEADQTIVLKVDLRDALLHGAGIRKKLQEMPEAVRRSQLPALARELHRAIMLFDALDRGVLTAGKLTFRKAT